MIDLSDDDAIHGVMDLECVSGVNPHATVVHAWTPCPIPSRLQDSEIHLLGTRCDEFQSLIVNM